MLSACANQELSRPTTEEGPLTSWNPDGTSARMRTSGWPQASSLSESRSDKATTKSSPVASSTLIIVLTRFPDLSFPEMIEAPNLLTLPLVSLAEAGGARSESYLLDNLRRPHDCGAF